MMLYFFFFFVATRVLIICTLLGHFICPKGVPLPPPTIVFMCVSAGTCILWCLCADQRAISGVYPCLLPCLTQLAVLRVRGEYVCFSILPTGVQGLQTGVLCTPFLKCGIRTHRFVWQVLYTLNCFPAYPKALFQNLGPAVPPAGLPSRPALVHIPPTPSITAFCVYSWMFCSPGRWLAHEGRSPSCISFLPSSASSLNDHQSCGANSQIITDG